MHWVTGKDLVQNSVDTIQPEKFVALACVIDASKEVALNNDFILTVEFCVEWESIHGRIASGSWLIFRTDWHKRVAEPAAFLNVIDEGDAGTHGAHTPGPSQACIEWLIRERDIIGFGCETLNTDAGQSFRWPMPYPCHTLMHGANKFGLQCLSNTDQLPPTGALILAAPLKMLNGSGSPVRALAIVPRH